MRDLPNRAVPSGLMMADQVRHESAVGPADGAPGAKPKHFDEVPKVRKGGSLRGKLTVLREQIRKVPP